MSNNLIDALQAAGIDAREELDNEIVFDPATEPRRVWEEISRAYGVTVIVLTASSEPEQETALMEEGADDYIRKPIDPASFIARVRGVLRRARMT